VTEPTHPTPRDPAELGFETIVYAKEPPRATITLNRPDVLNAFDFRMLREIARACEDASWDDAIRVVVVTGTGRAFCVGADLKSWQADYLGRPGEYWKWFGAFKDAHDRMREIGKPTVARINGICVGGGNELQMACDLAVMVDDAFIRHVGPEHGSVPAGGATQWLPVMVGDPGDGPADGVSGFGFTTGGGLRWVYTAVAFSLDVTFVRVNLHQEAHHDLGDELHTMDTPAFDLEGNLLAVTLGFGFAL